jgi:alpha-ribazole phosphatase
MTHLLLVRHGETDWNIQRRHQGQQDIPLNARGRQQIEAVARRLAGEKIDAVYASDLSRAWQTAEAIVTHHDGLSILEEPRLREMHFGEWEGLTHEEIQQRQPAASENWTKILMGEGPPKGENLPQFAARIQAMLDEVVAAHPRERVLLVAHGGTLMVLLCLLLAHPIANYWQFRLEKASLSEVWVYPEGAILMLLNDQHHLEGLKSDI